MTANGALHVCSEEADVTTSLLLLVRVSHMAKPAVSGLGKYKPPAGSEVWPRRRQSAEGNMGAGSGPEADDGRPGSVPGVGTLSCGQGAAPEGFEVRV